MPAVIESPSGMTRRVLKSVSASVLLPVVPGSAFATPAVPRPTTRPTAMTLVRALPPTHLRTMDPPHSSTRHLSVRVPGGTDESLRGAAGCEQGAGTYRVLRSPSRGSG